MSTFTLPHPVALQGVNLRRAAAEEGVDVTGTIGVLDRLLAEGLADEGEYRACIAALLEAIGDNVLDDAFRSSR